MVFYMNLYRKCDFLCEGCVEFYYDRRRQEMLGIQKIVSIIFLLTGLRIYMGEYKAQGPTLCPTEGRALRGPRALYSPV